MDPIKTAAANFVYRGPAPDIGDLWVQRVPHDRSVRSVWKPTDAERRLIAEGGAIELAIFYMEPIPPVSIVALPPELSQPVGEHEFRVGDDDLPKRPVTDSPQA